ncbi:ATP-binding cassette domain-containing protein [bacterium]|nr:ATP-binding cassette domain-containing protein [bacterium]
MIEVKELTKRFGQKLAVDGISFKVGKGEVLGFLGPNAAGKSTTMRMITGYLPPSSGTALVGGYDIVRNSLQARRRIGYLPENAPAYPDMTVIAFLDFIAEVRGFTGRERRARVSATIDKCFLNDVRYQQVSTLSKGYNQRVCFAQAILHDPEYLIMDEPTDGLDPNQKHEVRSMIRDMAKDKTIILSTHNLEEVDVVCTRVIIIASGKIVADKTPLELKALSESHGTACFTVCNAEPEGVIAGMEGLHGVKDVLKVGEGEGRFTLRAIPSDPSAPVAEVIVRYCLDRGIRLENMRIEEGRLDEVFRQITRPDQRAV